MAALRPRATCRSRGGHRGRRGGRPCGRGTGREATSRSKACGGSDFAADATSRSGGGATSRSGAKPTLRSKGDDLAVGPGMPCTTLTPATHPPAERHPSRARPSTNRGTHSPASRPHTPLAAPLSTNCRAKRHRAPRQPAAAHTILREHAPRTYLHRRAAAAPSHLLNRCHHAPTATPKGGRRRVSASGRGPSRQAPGRTSHCRRCTTA